MKYCESHSCHTFSLIHLFSSLFSSLCSNYWKSLPCEDTGGLELDCMSSCDSPSPRPHRCLQTFFLSFRITFLTLFINPFRSPLPSLLFSLVQHNQRWEDRRLGQEEGTIFGLITRGRRKGGVEEDIKQEQKYGNSRWESGRNYRSCPSQ